MVAGCRRGWCGIGPHLLPGVVRVAGNLLTKLSQPFAAVVLPKRTSHTSALAGGATLSPRLGLTRRVQEPVRSRP